MDDSTTVPLGYKGTKVGTIPSDWNTQTLGEIGQCLIGLTYDPSNVHPDGLLVLRSSNIGDDDLQFDDNVYVDVAVPERIIVRDGDLLICVRNGSQRLIGKCALINSRAKGMTFGAFMAVFRSPYNSFVSYCFQSNLVKRQIHEHLGATINQITNKSLKSFRIPFPPPAEQRAIAEALSNVDGLLRALEALIAKKRAIKQAAMQQLLTGKTRLPGFSGKWVTTSMDRIGSTYGGLSGKIKADFGTGNVRYVTFLNILENVVLNPEQFGNVRVAPGESQNRVLKGDLLFNGTSETPGDLAMGAVLAEEEENLYLNSFCFGFRIHDQSKYHSLFLAYFFRGSTGRTIMYALAQGVTRYNMSKSQFLVLALSIPSIEEQTAITTVLSDMDTEIAALECRRDKTRAIKQGMMQQLLTGCVRLVGPSLAEASA